MAREIAATAPADVLLVGVLKGSFVFLADLVRALDRAGAAPEVEFLHLSSYGPARSSAGPVRLLGEPTVAVSGRDIVVVDDICDSGTSLDFACRFLAGRGATRVRSCVLLDKPARRRLAFVTDFVGFTVGDEFVVGYGLDDAEKFRHLPYLAVTDGG